MNNLFNKYFYCSFTISKCLFCSRLLIFASILFYYLVLFYCIILTGIQEKEKNNKIKKNILNSIEFEILLVHLVICFYSFVVQFLFCFISIKTIHTNTQT